MEHRLIQKINTEQKELELKAMTAACRAIGFSETEQQDVIRHYEWMLTLRLLQNKMEKTERMANQHTYAERNYLLALERAIAKHPLKLSDWTNAGRAMQRVYKEAYTKTR